MSRLLSIKNEIPNPPEMIYPRRRLTDRFSASSKRNLFVLWAPAGFGKTVLAHQALKNVQRKSKAWLTIDENDATIERFVEQFLKSLTSCNRTMFRELLAGDHSTPNGVATLLDELSFLCQEHKGAPVWFVMDNWECVNNEKSICDFVSRLLRYSNGKIKFILTSRVKPKIKLGKLLESGNADLLKQEDFEFTYKEFVGIASKRLEEPFPELVLKNIWKQSKGWGIQIGLLISILKRIDHNSTTELDKLYSQTANEYIIEEILDGLPQETVEFLIKTSLLKNISVDRCSALFKNKKHAQEQLETVRNSGIPLVSSEDTESVSLHPLVRDALAGQFEKYFSVNQRSEFTNEIYKDIVDSGQILEAIDLFMSASEFERALDEMNTHWWAILKVNGHGVVKKWLDRVPRSEHHNPSYVNLKSNLYVLYADYKTLELFLNEHLQPDRFAKGSESLGKLWVQHQWSRIFVGADLGYDSILQQWDALVESHGPFDEYIIAIAHFPLFYAAFLELSFTQSIKHMQESIESIPESKFETRVAANTNMAYVCCMGGEISKGREILEEMKDACIKSKSYVVIHLPYTDLIRSCFLECRFEKVFRTIAEFVKASSNHPHSLETARPAIESIEGASLFQMGQTRKGLKLLQSACDRFDKQSIPDYIDTALDVEFYSLIAGKPIVVLSDDARPSKGAANSNRLKQLIIELYGSIQECDESGGLQRMKELVSIVSEKDVKPWDVTVNLYAVYYYFTYGKYEPMASHLKKALQVFGMTDWRIYHCPNDEVSSLAILLAVAKNMYDNQARRLVSNDKRVNFVSGFEKLFSANMISGDEVCRLLEFAIANQVRGLRDVIKKLSMTKDAKIKRLVTQYCDEYRGFKLPPVEIKVLGALEVYTDRSLVTISRKKSRMILEILSLTYPASIHEEELIERLWPNKESKSGRINLQTSVSELRKSLDPYFEPRGVSYVRHSDNCYELVLPEGSSIDYRKFKTGLDKAQAEHCAGAGATAQNIDSLERALNLYVDELLPERRYESYTVERRESLRELYLSGVLTLASAHSSQGNFASADTILDKALRIDPLWADGIEESIKVLLKQNKSLKALRRFREYEKIMKEELNLTPDISLRDMFEEL